MSSFVTVKTESLTGLALNWAVDAVLSEEATVVYKKPDGTLLFAAAGVPVLGGIDSFSSVWAKGGPIIGKAGILFSKDGDRFIASGEGLVTMQGQDHLVAAMRCYVASNLGLEIEVPILLLS